MGKKKKILAADEREHFCPVCVRKYIAKGYLASCPTFLDHDMILMKREAAKTKVSFRKVRAKKASPKK